MNHSPRQKLNALLFLMAGFVAMVVGGYFGSSALVIIVFAATIAYLASNRNVRFDSTKNRNRRF